jgi:enoyl-CoA hydratase/carnithine racemase
METLLVDRDDRGIVTVTLNRPAKKNAINGPMWDELLAVFREIQVSTTDRVVILTGTQGAFCSGADVTEMTSGPRRHWLQQMRFINEVALTLHRIPQPTIAKVNGVAAGAGANMAFGCDLIVAGSSARFSEIFHKRGLSVDFGGSWLLPRLIGLHKAKELAFFADIISAADALDLGLVNRVVADDELDAFVSGWASRLADGPPLALSETKRMLNNALHTSFDQTLEEEAQSQALNFTTNDTKEAMAAFVEKREPRFKGY